MTDQKLCPICEQMPHGGTLCRKHRKALADNLHALRIDYYQIQQYALRQAKPNTGGGARSPYPQAAYALAWGDLMDEVSGVLRPIGADVGVWEPRTPRLIRALINHVGRIATCSECGEAYRSIAKIESKVHDMIVPASERVIYGDCPECSSLVDGPARSKEVTCKVCGNTWNVRILALQRLARLENDPRRQITKTPAEAAKWLHKQTNLPVKRSNVSNWIARGQLPSAKQGNIKGTWIFDSIELLQCAQRTELER
ncbi:hypothetical protein OZX73_05415 [Bifidobacterium sp. ESL0775]|uniref:hypothetical protein n=1 Tax=Bifidobacterium sp. ESL0775 TaxID=2983230 RepID=UPI0023F969DE|nr:hypothetical protein [Bifidobacterium sp. ESL0775]WEV68731.1 hypothetical protein OZX73_05415 [Bifidobacterium sp. ESL0775]